MYPGEESDGCMGIQECVQEIVSTENSSAGQLADDIGVAAQLTVPSSGIHLCYPTKFSPAYTMSPDMNDMDSCAPSVKQMDCASLSDGGYESHDSPDSRESDLFDFFPPESFSELFPMLD
ncbi:hypothetical protein P5V15_012280 [Pogonomyrmex californicus]